MFRQLDAASQVPGVPIPTFATSDTNTARQGIVQNGPIEVTFSQSVDALSMDFVENCDPALGECATHMHRFVARNDSGRVLVDTLAGILTPTPHVLATIERVGIRSVSMYADSADIDSDGIPNESDTRVIPGWYTLSFRPDSSCPPSGDSVLDSKQVRDEICDAYAKSGTPPNFIEHGGDIYKM